MMEIGQNQCIWAIRLGLCKEDLTSVAQGGTDRPLSRRDDTPMLAVREASMEEEHCDAITSDHEPDPPFHFPLSRNAEVRASLVASRCPW
jgi:hypothetical protein